MCPVLAATCLPRAADEHSAVEVLKRESPVWDGKSPKAVPRLGAGALFDFPLNDEAVASDTRWPRVGEQTSVEDSNPVLECTINDS